jgi:hypothetical protein
MKTLTTFFLIAAAAVAQQNNPNAPLWSLDAKCSDGTKIGGGTPFDNTTSITTFLNRASQTNNIAMYPTGCGVITGVVIPATTGNVTIDGGNLNNGFFVKSGSNSPAISNVTAGSPLRAPWMPAAYPPFGTPVPTISNFGSIEIKNLTLNINGGVGNDCTKNVNCVATNGGEPFYLAYSKGYQTLAPPGTTVLENATPFPSSPTARDFVVIKNGANSTSCTRSGSSRVACFWNGSAWVPDGGTSNLYNWVTGAEISSIFNLNVDNVRMINSPSFHWRVTNATNVSIRNSVVERTAYDAAFSYDGYNISGPAKNVSLINNICKNIHDDCTAINAAAIEGYGGRIENVNVDGLKVETVFDALNAYGDIGMLNATNITGTGVEGSLLRVLGGDTYVSPSNRGYGPTVNISNSRFSFLATGENRLLDIAVGQAFSVTYNNVVGVGRNNATTAAPFGCSTTGSFVQLGKLSVINSGIRATPTANNLHGLIDIGEASDCQVGDVVIDNPIFEPFAGSPSKLAYVINVANPGGSGAVTRLYLNNIDCNKFTAMLGPAGLANIAGIGGNALSSSSCGLSIPDAKAINNTLYYSSDHGSYPTIKYGGTPGGVDGSAYVIPISSATAPLQLITEYLGTCAAPGFAFRGYLGSGISGNAPGNQLLLCAGAGQAAIAGFSGGRGSLTTDKYFTITNCTGISNPTNCGSASAGSFTLLAGNTTATVNTTAVAAGSQIEVFFDASLGALLGVTCNTTSPAPYVSARTAATSFVVTGVAPAANPACLAFRITN